MVLDEIIDAPCDPVLLVKRRELSLASINLVTVALPEIISNRSRSPHIRRRDGRGILAEVLRSVECALLLGESGPIRRGIVDVV